jgi:hypothetical protein
MEADGRKETLIAAQKSFFDHSSAPLRCRSKTRPPGSDPADGETENGERKNLNSPSEPPFPASNKTKQTVKTAKKIPLLEGGKTGRGI